MAGTSLAKKLQLPHLSANIATELAAGLADAEGIKVRYGITDEEWEQLRQNPAFRNMCREALAKWAGDMNAGKRITVKSEVALEDSIQVLYEIAHDAEAPPMARIASVTEMAKLAGRNAKEGQGGGSAGPGFAINIEINTGGEQTDRVTIEGRTLEQLEQDVA